MSSDYRRSRTTLLACAIGAAASAALLAVALITAGREPDITLARTIRTVDATMVLLTAAVGLYFLRYRGPAWQSWWLSLWTFAFIAFAVHLGFAIFGTFGGDFSAIFHSPDLVSHPRLDLILAAWWGAEILIAWLGSDQNCFVRVQRALLHVILTYAFFQATREEGVSPIGHALGTVLVIVAAACAIFWASVRPPIPQQVPQPH